MILESFNFFGLKFSTFSKEELIQNIHDIIVGQEKQIFYGYSLGTIPLFKSYTNLYEYSNSADLIVTDGEQMFWLLKLFGYKIKYNLSIPYLVDLVLEQANLHGYSVMIIGGSEEIKNKAGKNLKVKFSGIKLHSGINGYFNDSDEEKIIEEINQKMPNILLIGISSPKKERIAFEWKNRLNTNIIIPCGGMIDIIAGKTKVSPKWIKKLGLATPYRVLQEPRRLLLLNIWLTYEILFKIIPVLLYMKLTGNKNYNISNLYK